MQVRWEYLTPPEFKALAQEEKVCVVPMGVLERHGDHMPFGTDALLAHTIAVEAAQQEPCVVFPPYWFGQVHEAACFAGAINLPATLLLTLLETVLDQIAHNGFGKIVILNAHGGNNDFLRFFAMSQVDREVPYTLYIIGTGDGPRAQGLRIWETDGGHADERETSMMMAAVPDTVKLAYQRFEEPILPGQALDDLNAHTGLWWYAKFPEHVTGCPDRATKEKGELALEAAAKDVAVQLRKIKEDTVVPQLQREFYRRVREVPHGK